MSKIWISITAKIKRKIVYIIYLRNAWICWKIEYPELQKFVGILCTLYMYRMSRFPNKLNIHSCGNSTKNCVHYTCTECLDWKKNWMSIAEKMQQKIVYVIYLRNVWISKKIECPKLRKLNRKLCTLYVRKVWICRKIQYLELRKFNGKLCTLYMYRMSGLV